MQKQRRKIMYLLQNNFEKCRSYFNSKILSKKNCSQINSILRLMNRCNSEASKSLNFLLKIINHFYPISCARGSSREEKLPRFSISNIPFKGIAGPCKYARYNITVCRGLSKSTRVPPVLDGTRDAYLSER